MKEYKKVLIFTIVLVVFETIMYLLAKFSPFEPTILLSTLDQKLPVIQSFVMFYYLWYIYLIVLPCIFYYKDKKNFYKYFTLTALSVIIAFFIFFLFPTTIERGNIVFEENTIFTILLKIIYFTDTPILNCLPSMHCTLCFIFIYLTLKLRNFKWYYKLLIIITNVLIIVSTLLIKQHVIWDVLAALLLVIICNKIDRKFNLSEKFAIKYDEINIK